MTTRIRKGEGRSIALPAGSNVQAAIFADYIGRTSLRGDRTAMLELRIDENGKPVGTRAERRAAARALRKVSHAG